MTPTHPVPPSLSWMISYLNNLGPNTWQLKYNITYHDIWYDLWLISLLLWYRAAYLAVQTSTWRRMSWEAWRSCRPWARWEVSGALSLSADFVHQQQWWAFPFYFTHENQHKLRTTSFTNVHEEHQMERALSQHKHQMSAGQTEVSQHWREFVERRATTASGPTHRPAQDRWAQRQDTNKQRATRHTVTCCRRPAQDRWAAQTEIGNKQTT